MGEQPPDFVKKRPPGTWGRNSGTYTISRHNSGRGPTTGNKGITEPKRTSTRPVQTHLTSDLFSFRLPLPPVHRWRPLRVYGESTNNLHGQTPYYVVVRQSEIWILNNSLSLKRGKEIMGTSDVQFKNNVIVSFFSFF